MLFDIVKPLQEEVLKGLSNKQPKIVTACLLVIREAVRDFGNKVIALKPVVKSLQKVLEHSDKNVREEAKQLTVELYRWIGQALKPSLQNIKPVQVSTSRFDKHFNNYKLQQSF